VLPEHQSDNHHDNVPLHHEVNVAVLPTRGLRVVLNADAKERVILAEEAGVQSVKNFTGELLFKRWHKNGVTVTGQVMADIVQQCVVTLDPVDGKVSEQIDRTFVPENSKLARPRLSSEGELLLDYEGKDEPELFSGDTLNAWEIALEHFQLGIEPFPKKPDVALDEAEGFTQEGPADAGELHKPFAGLKDLLKPKG